MREPDGLESSELERLETREWLDSLDYVLESRGAARAGRLLQKLRVRAEEAGVKLPYVANTPYINTIPADVEPPYPGSREIERRIKSLIRWNALAMVVRANRLSSGIGGHISTYASTATLYEVGFNHFFRGKDHPSPDLMILLYRKAGRNADAQRLESRLRALLALADAGHPIFQRLAQQ